MEIGHSWFQEAGKRIHNDGIFVGCPLELFELTSRDLFCVALMEGLQKENSVLEIGCGCLRTGYWFIQYLNDGKYCGLEPNQKMLDAGIDKILNGDLTRKHPDFHANDQFDFSVFDRKFDYIVAFSIWSHASKKQIIKMLDEFKKFGNKNSKLIASWAPTNDSTQDYDGLDWVGRSHLSDQPGYVCHSKDWLMKESTNRGMNLKLIDLFTTISQSWIVIEK